MIKAMELQATRCLCVVAMLLVAGLAGMETAHGAGECGRAPVDQVALKLAPCAAATQDPRAAVPPACCAQVRAIGRNPKCLCAVMLSGTARKAGVKPAVAMTIPKRCAIANRPVGYKCGRKQRDPCDARTFPLKDQRTASTSLAFILFRSLSAFPLCSIYPAMRGDDDEQEQSDGAGT